ncbi:MAG TPA: hypothetical protein VGH98_19105 [Gemmatimonadaceae bacterium]|jgi:hypothetical protein
MCDIPAVNESLGGEAERLWHTAHEAIIMIGSMLLAISSVMPLLVLERRAAQVLAVRAA